MPVRRLRARTFRNLADARIELPDGVTLLAGPNGAGKTNLLEALYFGLTGASWRTRAERELIAFGADHARVEVEIRSGSQRTELATVAQRAAGKTRRVDGNPVTAAGRPRGAAGGRGLLARPPRAGQGPARGAAIPSRPARRGAVAGARRLAAPLRPRPRAAKRAPGPHPRRSGVRRLPRRLGPRAGARGHGRDRRARRRGGEARRAVSRARRPASGSRAIRSCATPRAATPPTRDGLAGELRERRDSDLRLGRTTHGPHLDEVQISARRPRAAALRVAGPAARRAARSAVLRARGAAGDRRGAPADAARRRDERARRRAPRAARRAAWPAAARP